MCINELIAPDGILGEDKPLKQLIVDLLQPVEIRYFVPITGHKFVCVIGWVESRRKTDYQTWMSVKCGIISRPRRERQPLALPARKLFQELRLAEISWDNDIMHEYKRTWLQWLSDIYNVIKLRIHNHVGLTKSTEVGLEFMCSPMSPRMATGQSGTCVRSELVAGLFVTR